MMLALAAQQDKQGLVVFERGLAVLLGGPLFRFLQLAEELGPAFERGVGGFRQA